MKFSTIKSMIAEEIFQKIASQKPPVIYISGKTSTGKSTFARRLRDELGYRIIELEAVLLTIIEERKLDEQLTFRNVLHDAGDSLEKRLFFEATAHLINEALASGELLVIEGAVANTETLKRILMPAASPLFLYFHPNNLDVYIRNLTKRFMEAGENSYGGLPMKFWKLIDDTAFVAFCQTRTLTPALRAAIREYAVMSQGQSQHRLEEYCQVFGDVTVVEIAD